MNDETQKPNPPKGDTDAKPDTKPDTKPDVKAESAEQKPKPAAKKRRGMPARKARVKEKKGVGFFTVFVMMVLATLGGAVLSQAYNLYGPNQKQSVSAAQIQALEARIKALPTPQTVDLAPLMTRIEALEARPVASSNGVIGTTEDETVSVPRDSVASVDIDARLTALEAKDEADLEPLEARLAALEARPVAPSNAESAVPDDFAARLEALEKTFEEASEEITGLSSLADRVGVLETVNETPQDISPELLERLNTLEASVQALPEPPEPVDLSSVEARIASLEAEAQALKTTQADVLKATTPIPAFPSEAVIKALENTDVASDKGWFGKTFDKYVLADNAEAIKTVSRVELLLQQGRVDMALEQVQSLPEPAQVAAKDWIDAVIARRR